MVKSEYEFAMIYVAALAWLDLALAGPVALDAAAAAITTRWRPIAAGDVPSAELREEADAMNLRDVSQYGNGRGKMKRGRRYTKGNENGPPGGEREAP